MVKYVAKIDTTLGHKVSADQLSESDPYHSTRLIGVLQCVTYLLSYHVVSNRNVVFVDINQPGNRTRLLKTLRDLADIDKSSEDIFLSSVRDKYQERPTELENLTLLQYAKHWEVFTKNIPKSSSDKVYLDKKMRYIAERRKCLIPRERYLTPLDKEDYYYQQLLLRVPHHSDAFLSNNNNTTCREDCILRAIFAEEKDAEEALDYTARRHFDPKRI